MMKPVRWNGTDKRFKEIECEYFLRDMNIDVHGSLIIKDEDELRPLVIRHGFWIAIWHGEPSEVDHKKGRALRRLWHLEREKLSAMTSIHKEVESLRVDYQHQFAVLEIGMNDSELGKIEFTQAAIDVLNERHRQQSKEGFSTADDDRRGTNALALMAACYARNSVGCMRKCDGHFWPVGVQFYWWRPSTERRNLVKAGALILAEIERLDRAAREENK